ncbi:MAG: phage tail assembly protein [Pseudomonadota bacterium]
MTDYKDIPRDKKTGDILVNEVRLPIMDRLLSPITVDGTEIKDVSVREPTVLDLEVANKEVSELGKTSRLLAQVMNLAPDDIKKLGSRDFSRLGSLVAAFL